MRIEALARGAGLQRLGGQLGARLYKAERGAEFAQAILGRKQASMTAVYDDMRDQGWAQVG